MLNGKFEEPRSEINDKVISFPNYEPDKAFG